MTSGTPINRPVQPRFGAGSGLQSPLGGDDLTNQWKKTKVPSSSTFGLATTVARLVSEMAKLRRRVITPPGVGTAGLNPRGEYDATGKTNYAALDLVVVRGGSNAGTFYAIVDVPAATGTQPIPTCPDTGNQSWICISNSPPLGNWM